jgi:transaldolase
VSTNPLKKLTALGQSIWLDYINRDLITTGQLKKLITEDDLRGMTSNPSIFEKAIAESHYTPDINRLSKEAKTPAEIYEALTQKDVQDAADEFRKLYDETKGHDGYVSLEVNPHLAHETEGTLSEARRLWKAVNRPNVMIKIPATKAGLPAIQQLISEGININVTLLFGLPRYRAVAECFIAGLKARQAQGSAIDRIASVASFFISRIDVAVDPLLKKRVAEHAEMKNFATTLQGEIAIASARQAYQIYHEIFQSSDFKQLEKQGAQTQRLLWASTSTKNPDYSDTKYVEALIGPDTVDTLPLETIDAYRNHGDPIARLTLDPTETIAHFEILRELGIDLDVITQRLEDEGVEKFIKSYDQLLSTLRTSIASL